MIEFTQSTEKYQPPYIEKHFSSLEGLHMFSVQFLKDAAEIYEVLTRMRSVERNPTGYSIDDAPNFTTQLELPSVASTSKLQFGSPVLVLEQRVVRSRVSFMSNPHVVPKTGASQSCHPLPSLAFSLFSLSSANPVSRVADAAQKERLPGARKTIHWRRKTICDTQQIEPLAREGA
jgi:hypothetical protein